jgi:predicted PurR-regulated permease PerM
MAYLFNPVFKRIKKNTKRESSAASLTLLTSFLVLIIPLALIVTVSVLQIKGLLNSYNPSNIDFGKLGQQGIDWVNNVAGHIPGTHPVTTEQLQQGANKVVSSVAQWSLGILTSSVSGVSGFFTSIILYIYIFLNFLIYQNEILRTIKRLNPLGKQKSEVYLSKMGAMTSGMVRGQFVIALAQGIVGALILYIAGLKSVFFFMLIILTFLSVIPLGGGIVAIPIGIVMLLIGNIWQGLTVLLGHFLVVSNVDNLLRPRLVPKSAQLNSALVLLSVFAGISMFGFLGVIIGPVIMILITTTIQMYLEATNSNE